MPCRECTAVYGPTTDWLNGLSHNYTTYVIRILVYQGLCLDTLHCIAHNRDTNDLKGTSMEQQLNNLYVAIRRAKTMADDLAFATPDGADDLYGVSDELENAAGNIELAMERREATQTSV